jgi:hypothetical protein
MSTDTLDFAMNFEENQQSDADRKLFVIFYKDVVKNEVKSTEAGRPIFDEIDLVKIITPGSKDSYVGDATPQYQARFPQQWARYKAGKSQELSGTPLNQLPWLGVGQIAEFNAVGCHTVEQLVGMPDSVSQKFMGHHAIKLRAQSYLDHAKAEAPTLKMEAELKKRDEQIAELTLMVNGMKAARDKELAEKASQKSPGPPKG